MANDPMQFDTEEDAVQIALYLAAKTPAYLAWSREAEPDIGADGPPMIDAGVSAIDSCNANSIILSALVETLATKRETHWLHFAF